MFLFVFIIMRGLGWHICDCSNPFSLGIENLSIKLSNSQLFCQDFCIYITKLIWTKTIQIAIIVVFVYYYYQFNYYYYFNFHYSAMPPAGDN